MKLLALVLIGLVIGCGNKPSEHYWITPNGTIIPAPTPDNSYYCSGGERNETCTCTNNPDGSITMTCK